MKVQKLQEFFSILFARNKLKHLSEINRLLNQRLSWRWLPVCAPQSQGPQGPVVAEATSTDEDPGQVQDQLRRVRRGPAGTRDPRQTQRQQDSGDHLKRRASLRQPPETARDQLQIGGES